MTSMDSTAKPTSASRTVSTYLVLPPDTNHYGTIFGGQIMANIDKIGAITAMRHARLPVVTASSDSLDFLAPVAAGEAMHLEAFVASTGKTTIEVFVKVQSENLILGETKLTATAYLTFVAIGPDGKPTQVPAILPETDDERQQYDSAPKRRAVRQQRLQERRNRAE